MQEITGNIWDYHEKGHWIVITTNGTIKKNGSCVMGRGVALQAAKKFPDLPALIGQHLRDRGNDCFSVPILGIISFPTKHNWWEKSDLNLIEKSCKELVNLINNPCRGMETISKVYLVRPGCSNGKLDWKDVKPILEKYLDDRFAVVEWNG